jgi:hypothetical protein
MQGAAPHSYRVVPSRACLAGSNPRATLALTRPAADCRRDERTSLGLRLMHTHEASCSCGQLKVTCQGDPVRVSICHCLACQRRTGSPFGQQARWPEDKVRISGSSTTWERIGDEGSRIAFHFCPTCGSTVHYALDTMPGLVGIPVGAFADPTFPSPTYSVYEARKHSWIHVPEHIEHMD